MHTNRVSQAEMTEPSGKTSSKRREKGGNIREKKGRKKGEKKEQKKKEKRRKQKNLLTRYVGLSTSFLYKIRALKIS